MDFIEFPLFAKNLSLIGDDDEYLELQIHLAQRPDAGAVIPGSGGLRKLRWAGNGRGKRGGLRIIYYHVTAVGQILLMHVYAKNMQEDMSISQIKELKRQVEEHQP